MKSNFQVASLIANTNGAEITSKAINPAQSVGLISTLAAGNLSLLIYLVNNKVFQNDQHAPWLHKAVWAASFLINLITVSLPGRFDGDANRVEREAESGGTVDLPVWRTLFEPAGWAFAIWGVIYLTETLLVVFAQLTSYFDRNGVVTVALQKASPWWLVGSLSQALWCLSFRPKFKNYLWLPMSQLALGAVCFGGALHEFSLAMGPILNKDKIMLLLCRLPLSLHTTWLSAATLLNLNAWLAVTGSSASEQLALAFLSAFAAAALGTVTSIYYQDPLIAFTITWALTALAYKTKSKVSSSNKKSDFKTQASVGIPVQEALAIVESNLAKVMAFIGLGILAHGSAKPLQNLF